MSNNDLIHTSPRPFCAVCGTEGNSLYAGLMDVLFDAPGKWNIRQCPNSDCGLLWLDPMPLAHEIHKAYRVYPTHYDTENKSDNLSKIFLRAQAGYRARRFDFRSAGVSTFDRLLGVLPQALPPVCEHMDFPFVLFSKMPKGRLLELGCGGGDSMTLLGDWGWEVEGVDFDQAAVANAIAKGLRVRQGDLFACRYAADSFDAVYANHVLEHVPDPAAWMVECHRVLKTGGRCVMVTPNADSIGHRWFKSAWRGLEPPRHLHIFSPNSLAALASSAGFADFAIETSTRLAMAMFLETTMIRINGRTGAKAPFDLKVKAVISHFLTYACHCLSRNSGEELVFTGCKTK